MFEGVGVGVGLMFERVDFFWQRNGFTERPFDIKDLGFIWVWEWFHEWKI